MIVRYILNKERFDEMLNTIDYRTLFENTNVGIAAIEADALISMANAQLLKLLEVEESAFIGTNFLDWIYDEEDRRTLKENHIKRLRGAKDIPQNYDIRLKTKNGYVSVLINITFFKESSKTLASVLDTTQLQQTRQKLQETINAQEAILAAIPDLMFELSRDGVYLNVWAQNPEELAASKQTLLGNTVLEILPLRAAKEVMQAITECYKNGHSSGHQIEIQTPQAKLWFELSASLKHNTDALPSVIMLSRNITPTKELEFKLRHLSRHDSLTNLYNRRTLQELLLRDTHRANRYKTPLAVCMLDIDHFKNINDTYGHIMGDRVIQALSKLLQESLREIDYSGRYGGEEFVIVLPETNLAHAYDFSKRLLTKIAAMKFQSDTLGIFHITISIGVAEFDATHNSCEELIKAADNAMYQAKNAGRNCVKKSCLCSSDETQ